MKRMLLVTLFCLGGLRLQVVKAQAPPATSTSEAAVSPSELEDLRRRIADQQEQIRRLQQAVDEQQRILERKTVTLPGATPPEGAPAASGVHPVGPPPPGPQAEHKPSPLSISLGNTTLTPLGFMDATYFSRSTNVGSGIGTNFGGIPFNTSASGHLSETSFSAQNSRLGFRVDSNFKGAKVLGYLEADFLFNNDATSFQITSNSAGLRLRNYFVDVQKGKFEFLAGQDWSFLTPNRNGVSPIPGDIFYTQHVDTNYSVGLIWTRQPQFRFIVHPNKEFAIGVSIENPEQYLGGGAGASTVSLPAALNSALTTQFQPGGSNTGVPNWFPDVIAKATYDGHPGDKTMHVEAAGLIRGFKDYVTTATAPAIPGSHSTVGFGGSVNANLEVVKNVRLIANTFFSDGGGRYIFGLAPDVIVRPDGSLSALHSYSTLDGIEFQATKTASIAAYYGGAYIGRNVAFDPTATGSTPARPVFAGYGFASNSTTFNRAVQEFTMDYTQVLWKDANYGALTFMTQYSYLLRNPWYVAPGAPKSAHTNMVYVNLRYTLP
jgi:hypothetical protein